MTGYREPTNADRARWAQRALQAFADATRRSADGRNLYDEENVDEVLGDLMADLCHLVGMDRMDLAVVRGQHYYADELAEAAGPILPADAPLPGKEKADG